MMNRRNPLIALLLLAVTSVCFGQKTSAHLAQLQKDAEELQSCSLTMDIVTRTFVASHDMDLAVKANHLGAAMNKARGKGDFATIDQLSAAFSTSPQLVSIAASHGFTPRSLALALISVVQTFMSSAALSHGKTVADLPISLRGSPRNIRLFQDHQEEVSALFQKYPIELF